MNEQIVYKFRDWKNPNHKKNLIEGLLYFASPSQFNDPFDCLIIPRYDLLTKQQKIQKYREMVRTDNPHLTKKELNIEVSKWIQRDLLSGKNYFNYAEDILKNVHRFGIFSLSRVKTNILLWSHYSDSHTGFCIGYDEDSLYNFVINSFLYIKMVADKRDVVYSENYPLIIPDETITDEEFIIKPIITKSADWAYEKEVRIILYDGAKNYLKLVNTEIVKEIILGCNICKENKEEIIEVAKQKFPQTKILQAKKHSGKFQLVFENIL